MINQVNKTTNGMYLLVDNACIHHSRIVKDYMEQTENKLLFFVPYSPDYNPIENIFLIIKNEIRFIGIKFTDTFNGIVSVCL